MRTMVIHLSSMLTQDIVMIMVIVPGKIEVGFRNGVEIDIFGNLDMWLNLIDVVNEYIICYICWTMGSSAQLRRFKCNITQTQTGEYQVKFRRRDSVTSQNPLIMSVLSADSSKSTDYESPNENPKV